MTIYENLPKAGTSLGRYFEDFDYFFPNSLRFLVAIGLKALGLSSKGLAFNQSSSQFALIDDAIKTAQLIRNKCVRYWMDNKGVGQYDLSKLCAVLAKEFEWAGKLNS
jgi:hypothetical protein